MNIFLLHSDPVICAEQHCDKHVVKMCIEYAQMLSTAHRVLDGNMLIDSATGRRTKRWELQSDLNALLYKATHYNHPSTKWVRESADNYKWLYSLFIALLDEFEYRFGKIHATSRLAEPLLSIPKNIHKGILTDIPMCMPDEYKTSCAIESYHNFYKYDKIKFAKYTKREIPPWLAGYFYFYF